MQSRCISACYHIVRVKFLHPDMGMRKLYVNQLNSGAHGKETNRKNRTMSTYIFSYLFLFLLYIDITKYIIRVSYFLEAPYIFFLLEFPASQDKGNLESIKILSESCYCTKNKFAINMIIQFHKPLSQSVDKNPQIKCVIKRFVLSPTSFPK